MNLIPGRATAEGTAAFHARSNSAATDGETRRFGALSLSSLGIGTYLGADDDVVDAQYRAAISTALRSGVNVVDAAINYRSQRSERVIGAVLHEAIAAGTLRREEVLVATKAGYVPYDGARPRSLPDFIEENYFGPGIIERDQLVSGVHCMSPRYLHDQIERSRRNLGLATIDIYYLHNPESHLEGVSRALWEDRLRRAFEAFEQAASDGKIAVYGAATWHGFRRPERDPGHHSLLDFVRLAEDVGGREHRFRVVQLPYNLGMIEAFHSANQRAPKAADPEARVTFLEAARALEVYVMASAAILQGQLTERLPDEIRHTLGFHTDAQRSIQFVRSTPGIGTALVGMKNAEHVKQNAEVLRSPPLPEAALRRLYAEAD